MNLEKYNPHWKENYFYEFDKRRAIFDILIKNVRNRQIISISGLRRTGKTVLLKQLINYLIKEKTPRLALLYYSFDEEQPKIEDIINEFEKLKGNKEKSKLYIFFDEIQKLNNWQNQIKFFYDNHNIKFFVSGSSSLFIKNSAKESLAGRSFDFYLPPLNFKEFLIFRNKSELIQKPRIFKTELKKEFSLYTKRQFIETVGESEEFITEYVKSILEKIVYIDIPKVFPIENKELLLRLLRIIAANPGMIIQYENLARELGINRVTLSNYLFYLEEAFLIKKIYNFSKNRLTSEKKSKKFYLNSTSFFPYLNSIVEESKLIENLVAIETNAKFFWRTPFRQEIDFILEKDKKIFPLEVKYKNIITNNDIKTMTKFCLKNKLNQATIITKDSEERKIISKEGKKIKIEYIPVQKFLLMNQN